ncbi:MAG: hypothetical protein MUF51_09380, partial [Vicinamibacteria bacterium]|nr:hypothetical protein [Vicinamibacteria bacterium]
MRFRIGGGWILAAAAALLLFAWACWPARAAFFTADDFLLLLKSRPQSLPESARFFTTNWGGGRLEGGYYRPIVNLSLGWDGWLFGLDPAGYRATNVVAHLLATLMAFALLRRYELEPESAFMAALFFLLHPLHDQAIFWMSGRTDVLCAVFYFACLCFATGTSRRARLLSWLALMLALLSKEMAVTLPLVLTLREWMVASSDGRKRGMTAWRRTRVHWTLMSAWFIGRYLLLGGLGGDASFLRFERPALQSAARLVAWAFLPFDWTGLKPFLRAHPSILVAAGVALASLGALAVWRARRSRLTIFFMAWLAVSLAPIAARQHAWYLYIPSLAACALLAQMLRQVARSAWPGRVATAAGAIVFALLLHGNARQMAMAGHVAHAAVGRLAAEPAREVFLLNAPTALAGRFVILTADEHYQAALALFAQGAVPRVTVMNFIYLSRPDRLRADARVAGDDLTLRLA